MTALIWKELRENFKWALIAMLVLAGAECFALYSKRNGYEMDLYFYDGITLCKSPLLMVTTFGCAAAGLMLGLVQILPELKRDRWAALLHRPVSRGTIFGGKAAAGILLYLVATVPPFLFVVWLVATPGNFAVPFIPAMIQPGIADICAGVLYYFAGLLLALQRGKVARVLPLFAAVFVTNFILSTALFRVALEAVLAMALVLAIAGWGAIQNQESPRRRPFVAWLAFLAVMFYGACGIGELGKYLVNIMAPTTNGTYMDYAAVKDGTPMRITYSDGVVTAAENADGSPVTDPKLRPDRIRNQLNYLNATTQYVGNSHGWKPAYSWRTYRESSTYLYTSTTFYKPRLEQWFYLLEKRSLVGYAPMRKEAIGKLGADGFQPATATVPGFAADIQLQSFTDTTGVIHGPDFIRLADFVKRTITDLPLPEPGPVFGIEEDRCYKEDGDGMLFTSVALKNGIAIYDDKQALVLQLPYRHDTDRWGQISVAAGGDLDRLFVWYEPSVWIDRAERETMPIHVDELDRSGAVIKSSTLPPLPFAKTFRLRSYVGDRLQSGALFAGDFIYWKIGAALGSERLAKTLGDRLKDSQTRQVAIAIFVISLVLAGMTVAWARRAGKPWSEVLAWAGFVLLFNLPGFIAFRLCATWPRSIPCPACRHSRRLDSTYCPHCGAAWPEPKPVDTEIFDNAGTQALAAVD